MPQKSLFWTTNGIGDGPLEGYTADDFALLMRLLTTPDSEAEEGILRGVGDELSVSGISSPLTVGAGAAMVYGRLKAFSPGTVAVPSPVTGLTGGRINVKADWATQTVEVVAQLNTDGNPAIPALVQTPGSEWSIPLFTATVSPAGVIALADARKFCLFASVLSADRIIDVAALSIIGRASNSAGLADAITAAADGQVLRRIGDILAFGQLATAGIADGAVTADKIADGAVGTTQLDAGAVETANLADDCVDDSKVGARVPKLANRQGGHASNWLMQGANNYTPGLVAGQIGAASVVFGASDTLATIEVTFPATFANTPLVLTTMQYVSGMTPSEYTIVVYMATAASVLLRVTRSSAADGALTVPLIWEAIGPE